MDMSRRRTKVKGGVVAGSVWETRIKSDEVKGGIFKIFLEGEDTTDNTCHQQNNNKQDDDNNNNQTLPCLSSNGLIVDGVAISGKRKTWKSKTFDGFDKTQFQSSKDVSLTVDGTKNNPVQVSKSRSELEASGSTSIDGIKRNPVKGKKPLERNEKSPVQIRKPRVEVSKGFNGLSRETTIDSAEKIERRSKPGTNNKVSNDPKTSSNEFFEENDKSPIENCKEFGVCNALNVKSAPKTMINHIDDDDDDEEEEEEYFDQEEEVIVIESKSFDVKEVNVQEPSKPVHELKKSIAPLISTVSKHVPSLPNVYSNSTKSHPTKAPVSEEQKSLSKKQNKMQSLVDLIMWRNITKSALVFCTGLFFVVYSSYSTNTDISLITVISYLGLVCLAAVFMYRSILYRKVVAKSHTKYLVGEEEAIWLMKLVLPYVNELLLILKALFFGDPATTMKVAGLLFVLARWGSSITILNMAKLGFVGIFTLPKIYCSYSTRLTAYGKYWTERLRDPWDSCLHKKMIAIAIFALVWNFFSIVVRIWAVFMLFVVFRYHQQSTVGDGDGETSCEGQRSQGQFACKAALSNKLKRIE